MSSPTLPVPKAKRIEQVPPRKAVSEGRNHQRAACVHMCQPAVSNKRHRSVDVATDDLGNHHGDPPGPPLVAVVPGTEQGVGLGSARPWDCNHVGIVAVVTIIWRHVLVKHWPVRRPRRGVRILGIAELQSS